MEITDQKNDNYIISIHNTQPKNNLDKMLEETFLKIDSCIIDIADVDQLKQIHQKVVDLYTANKGKCTSKYRFSRPFTSTIYIEIGDFMTINLRKLKGVVK